jgi:branched-chain amino acid transport system ATP-binding protein
MSGEPEEKAALEVREIDSYYDDLQVLHKASIKIGQGETVALFGPNGHGKSTLLKAICGIHPPRDGAILYRGQNIAGIPTEKTVELGVALIPEDRNLFPDMSVIENLNLGAYSRRARKKSYKNLQFVYSLFPRLEERKYQLASTLSGGEGRMLAVARGLMSDATLLLVDEPSIGLSPLLKKLVFSSIHQIGKQTDTTILIVEQEVDLPLKLANRIYLLKRGTIILEKRASEISKAQIEKAYF